MTATSAAPPPRPAPLPDALVELAAQCGVATSYTDAHGVHRDVPEHSVRAVLAAMGVGAGGPVAGAGPEVPDHDDDNTTPTSTAAASDRAALEEVRLAPWRRVIAPTVVATEGSTSVVPIHIPQGATVTVSVQLEDPEAEPVALLPLGGDRITRSVDGITMEQVSVSVPGDLPAGWHRVVVVVVPDSTDPAAHSTDAASVTATATGSGNAPDTDSDPGTTSPPSGTADPARSPGATRAAHEATLIVAPPRIPLPAGLDERRAVGLAAQLYQVRSAGSWGIGDLADLADLAVWGARDLGADFVLVNPMHAGEPFPPVEPSPYLPTTRRFASPLYLRPELVPEYSHLSESDRARIRRLARITAGAPDTNELDANEFGADAIDANAIDGSKSTTSETNAHGPNRSERLDRNTSWTAKLEALRLIFTVPLASERAEAFDRFVDREGPGLQSFASWCAIAGEHGPDWTRWPVDLKDAGSDAVGRFADTHPDELRFHKWLQWLTAEQRADAQKAATDAGMRLGVLHDLAVGVHPAGADAWSLHRSLARGVSVGAPPDIYNQRGQDWSQPPLRPDALADEGYRQFRDIIRAALRDAGGLRIDHILGLFRLWWIPAGSPPTDGTYVHYDSDAMLAVLTLEASRAGAVVVGEDLGTVAPGVREALNVRGILGTSVMWFEQTRDTDTETDTVQPLPPEDYREYCMASLTTHDLAPTAGYVDLLHVDIRDELGQLTRDVADERRDAEAEIAGFAAEVRKRGLLEGDSVEDLVVALHEFVGQSPSVLLAVSLADLVGDRQPVNMPGTSVEYPNWSVPLTNGDGRPMLLGDVADCGLARRVFGVIDPRQRS